LWRVRSPDDEEGAQKGQPGGDGLGRYAGAAVPRRPDMPPLRRAALAEDPIEQFRDWYELAAREVPLADAMTLATVDREGAPDARMVLLKGFGPDGFRFFTNLGSAKALQLESAPRAALVLYWRELDRQVRVRGPARRLPEAESDEYFVSRPRDSQIGAWASPQSEPLANRAALDRRAREAERRFSDTAIPRPPFWGGFVVRPLEIEFWQGQVARLHDRFRYLRTDGGWRLERLAP
jgi:pyridoxamine 5'-phosphate oxidase